MKRIVLTSFALILSISFCLTAYPQGIPRPDERHRDNPQPTPQVPGDGRPDRSRPTDNQALITFTLEPAMIYPGDRVTLRWRVRDRRPNVAWTAPVHLRSSFAIVPALPDIVSNSGSFSFMAGATPRHGTFTISTGGALFHAEKKLDYHVTPTPEISRLAVEQSRGSFVLTSTASTRARLEIVGHNFGGGQDDSQALIEGSGRTVALTIESWTNTRVVARIPDNAPTGEVNIRLSLGGGRLLSNARPLTVFKSLTISNATLQAVVEALGLSQTLIHLNLGNNASSVSFSPALIALGATNLNFTVPNLERNVPQGARTGTSIVFPAGGFPEKVKYYVNNVDSNAVSLRIAGGQLVLRLRFESRGPEIKGKLKYCFVGAFGLFCASSHWTDGLAPDVQVNDAEVVIRFTPSAANGNLVISSASAAFDANFQIGGDFEDWLINALTDYRRQVRPAINTALTDAVNRAAVRNAISNALMNQLRSLGVNRVLSVSNANGSIAIRYE